MSKGGFHPESRLGQDLAEIQIGAGVYGQLDDREDVLIERLLTWLRGIFVAAPIHLSELERWERSWRAADHNADASVMELGVLAQEAQVFLGAVG